MRSGSARDCSSYILPGHKEGGHTAHILHKTADIRGLRRLQEQHQDVVHKDTVGGDVQGPSGACVHRIGYSEDAAGKGEGHTIYPGVLTDLTQKPEVQGVRRQGHYMRVREECKPDCQEVQIQGPCRDSHQELMLLEKLTGNYRSII